MTPDRLETRTPCTAWNLRQLLQRLNDSLDVVEQTVDLGRTGAELPPGLLHRCPVVHGWDISRACGRRRDAVPDALAGDMPLGFLGRGPAFALPGERTA